MITRIVVRTIESVYFLCKLQFVLCLLFAATLNGLNRSRRTHLQTLLIVLLNACS